MRAQLSPFSAWVGETGFYNSWGGEDGSCHSKNHTGCSGPELEEREREREREGARGGGRGGERQEVGGKKAWSRPLGLSPRLCYLLAM